MISLLWDLLQVFSLYPSQSCQQTYPALMDLKYAYVFIFCVISITLKPVKILFQYWFICYMVNYSVTTTKQVWFNWGYKWFLITLTDWTLFSLCLSRLKYSLCFPQISSFNQHALSSQIQTCSAMRPRHDDGFLKTFFPLSFILTFRVRLGFSKLD